MSNKEFVEELINHINTINKDKILFKRINPSRENQKFSIQESWFVNKHTKKEEVEIKLVLTTLKGENCILKKQYTIHERKENTADSIYHIIMSDILKYIIFAEESLYEDIHGIKQVHIPLKTIICVGYDDTKSRLVNESK